MSNTPLRWARIRFAGIARGTTTGGVSAFDFVQAIQDFERHGPTRGELPDLLLRRVAEHLGVAYPVVAEAQMPPPEALFSAIRNDALARFRELFDKGADPKLVDERGESALIWAANAEYRAVLLAAGADPNSRCRVALQYPGSFSNGHLGHTLLYKLCDAGRPVAQIRQLLDAGADVNAVEPAGETPLHRAAERGNAELTAFLLERAADPHAVDCYGRTAVL